MSSFALGRYPVHLGAGAKATVQEAFDGSMEWYERYARRNAADGAEGRLVSLFTFASSWDTWEVHPLGEELVVCVRGRITLHQEIDGEVRQALLGPGEAIVNPAGVWHTADTDGEAVALFVTAGAGTAHRPR